MISGKQWYYQTFGQNKVIHSFITYELKSYVDMCYVEICDMCYVKRYVDMCKSYVF